MNRQDFVDFIYYIEQAATKIEGKLYSPCIEKLEQMPVQEKCWINLIVKTRDTGNYMQSLLAILTDGIILAEYLPDEDDVSNPWKINSCSEIYIPFSEIVLLGYEY